MRTSLEKLLKEKNKKPEESFYGSYDSSVRKFVMTAGNFFKLETSEKWLDNLWLQDVLQEKCETKKDRAVYRSIKQQYISVTGQIADIKKKDPNGYAHIEELWALRAVKKSSRQALQDLESYYQSEAEQEIWQEYGIKAREAFVYKNTVCLGGFDDLRHRIPALQKVELPWIRTCPLLLSGIHSLVKSYRQGTDIGIVGGPCLFGTYEVEVRIRHQNGDSFSYDFSSGRRYDAKPGKMELADHIECYQHEIEEISFENRKQGLTIQEAESLEVLFVFADALHAKVAIPIPDISYLKYLSMILEPMDEAFRTRIVEKFRIETRKIADMYLAWIDGLKEKYPQTEVKVLHERDEKLCREFYEKRELYFQKSGLIHRLTAKRKKTDAIFDYISMLALPFYFWGTPQVIQIDNLDETDSYRKCSKVHKNAFTLSAVLYPERLCRNGKDTYFNAPSAYKDYLTEREPGKERNG